MHLYRSTRLYGDDHHDNDYEYDHDNGYENDDDDDNDDGILTLPGTWYT